MLAAVGARAVGGEATRVGGWGPLVDSFRFHVGVGSFLERVAAEKLMKEAKGEKVETKMRVTEASSASLVVGRR